jgi:hypothetical protein
MCTSHRRMIETLLAENNVRARRPGGEKVIISVLQHRTYLRPARVNRKKEAARFLFIRTLSSWTAAAATRVSRAGKINFIICRCGAHARNRRPTQRCATLRRCTWEWQCARVRQCGSQEISLFFNLPHCRSTLFYLSRCKCASSGL